MIHDNMVFNALRAARMRGERDGEHAQAAVVNAEGTNNGRMDTTSEVLPQHKRVRTGET